MLLLSSSDKGLISRPLLTQALHVAIAGAGKSVTGQAVEEGYESLKAGGGSPLVGKLLSSLQHTS